MVDFVLFVGFFPFVISQRGVWILCWYHLFPFRRALLATLFEFLFLPDSSEKHEHPNPIGRLDQTALEFASPSFLFVLCLVAFESDLPACCLI